MFKKYTINIAASLLLVMGLLLQWACTKKDDIDANKPNIELTNLPYDNLADYQFFTGNIADLSPNNGVLPYDLNTPLFSDYAQKTRFIYMPEGVSATYDDKAVVDFPVGTVIIKTFAFVHDLSNPESGRRILETRLLVRHTNKWEPYSYHWNEAQTEAIFKVTGKQIDVEWIHYDGQAKQTNYLIPNKNECKGCHNIDEVLHPIGPKIRNLNKAYPYADGMMNQLDKWKAMGYLSGGPASADAPKVPVWNDPSTGSLNDRARAYLDINCAHCHNPNGPANNTGLFLYSFEENPTALGICKPPVSAGDGSGGYDYGIVPGNPDESIMVHRMNSSEIDVAMPELARSVIHDEGVQLIKAWIETLEGECL